MGKKINLGVIVPILNEEANIATLILRIDKTLRSNNISYEVILVDDHSSDNSAEIINKLAKKYPLKFFVKEGKQGKAYSILEGYTKTSAEVVAMIDGDLQYPPEALPDMLASLASSGLVIANRKIRHATTLRNALSKTGRFVTSRLISQQNLDIQSGLKMFKRDIMGHLDIKNIDAWSLDVPLVQTALDLGYQIGTVDIEFSPRTNGNSKVNLFTTSKQILFGALKNRFQRKTVYHHIPQEKKSMRGAGVTYNKQKFVTHSTLHHSMSAIETFVGWQKGLIFFVMLALIFGSILAPLQTITTVIAILSTIYFVDVLFNLFLIVKSLHFPPEKSFTDDQLKQIDRSKLPVYSILCPLFREAHILPQFVHAMELLEWPKDKLEILLLLEENDPATIEAAQKMNLPKHFKVIVVPHSLPKTKPKACNYGLTHATGDYVVVYDAEDKPESNQLLKSYLAFQTSNTNIFCFQAKLNYYNPHQNFLTKLFTAEYSLWFDVVLTGLQAINTTIPLGGTSNHFRRSDLLKLEGWDPFNVTEDCDLGVRLFNLGYRTAIIDSVTYEEANSNWGNWLRQRSRWIKGYIQTYFVHMRHPIQLIKKQGIHAFIFQLVVGGKIAFMLINPLLWLATFAYFAFYSIFGALIEAFYPTPVFYMAVTSLLLGNFLCLYYYMIGVAKRGYWSLEKYVFFVPLYWLMVSLAATKAIFQLIVKPHYWEKTNHGLHLQLHAITQQELQSKTSKEKDFQRIIDSISSGIGAGGVLVVASWFSYFLNFIYASYLSRTLDFVQFGLINLIGSFIYLASIPFSALTGAITHQSAYILGKTNQPATQFWKNNRFSSFIISLLATLLWIILTPFFANFFQADSFLPFILFAPVWVIGTIFSVDTGFLSGNLRFFPIAIIAVIEAVAKLLIMFLLIELNLHNYVYVAVPGSMLIAMTLAWLLVKQLPVSPQQTHQHTHDKFPKKFFTLSALGKISNIIILGFDVILAKHFLSPIEAGQYTLVALIGKMVYFIATTFNAFIIPLVSKKEGEGVKSETIFSKILWATALCGLSVFTLLGVFGFVTAPILFGQKAILISPYLPTYSLAMVFFAVSSAISAYHLAKKHYFFVFLTALASIAELLLILFFHDSVGTIVNAILTVSTLSLVSSLLLHTFYEKTVLVMRNLIDFFGLIGPLPTTEHKLDKLSILIFNWRDTKHVWSGGAEVYIHELAKRWVAKGHKVTLFCGNDGRDPRYEKIDGVDIVRRGGFCFVYVWAFFYYIFRLRGKYDIIIDSENGIPFFTPLYCKEKIFLLIHHVHQEVFRQSLPYPAYLLASFLEQKLMPLVYRRTQVITVSPSSKADILDHNLTKHEPHIIYNGVDLQQYKPAAKSAIPLFSYIGRLKEHKSIPVFIKAAGIVINKIPNAKFIIAGDGPDKDRLFKLVRKLKLDHIIQFLGYISEAEKISLMQKSWACINPSLIEGWGITNIEANACGTPVIASNVAGLRDSVHNPHSGFLIPYGHVEDFARHMELLTNDFRLREKMSKESIQWAKKYQWDTSADQALKLITSYI